jgi:hypothetical protein
MRTRLILMAISAGVMVAGPGNAAEVPQQTAAPAPPPKPEKLICEKQIPIGTRLGAKEVCVTPEGMADRRRQERAGIEGIQAQPCLPTHQQDGHAAC